MAVISDKYLSQVMKTVEEIIEGLPRNERIITKKLRALILDTLPRVTEKVNYGVPYYAHHRLMLFIWPPSIQWGPKKEKYFKQGVTLGFCQGNRMSNENGMLKSEGRKQVYCLYFKDISEIDDAVIRALLFEAEMVDDQFAASRKS